MSPAFALLSAVTAPGVKINEDAYGLWPTSAAPRAAWVLDGVSGINDRALLPGPSDAAWFVAQVQEVLPALLSGSPDMPIMDLIGALAAELERRQSASWLDPRGADGRETPAASFAFVRLSGDEVEIARLGDCLVLAESDQGAVNILDDPVLQRIEAETKRAVLDLRATGITDLQEIRGRLIPLLRAQRQRRNRSDGYGVLAAEPACVAMAQTDRMTISRLRRLLLTSDGYYRLVDHYSAMNTAALVQATGAQGAEALVKRLRAIETDDPQCIAYPRLKTSDDATALLIGLDKTEP